ncbi:MAG: type II toxin-antitoxin system VapC family toxin [Gaiellaceae bacterium MAG52_C11]|nr:type II toxin-antitoxin system VapC family toxin [Candidatus Gaiellasilicea maunaloa]
MLVLDASLAVEACFLRVDLAQFVGLVAPPLLWPEARSVLHELGWRGAVTSTEAREAHSLLDGLPIERRDHPRLGAEAWRLADELGWAKTYDAEYVALASLLGCRLVTTDRRLRRDADRLGFVIGPLEL